jgi:hypothetical protein
VSLLPSAAPIFSVYPRHSLAVYPRLKLKSPPLLQIVIL